jgi:RNA recognition motif-containing protein
MKFPHVVLFFFFSSCKVYVGNLSFKTEDQDLQEFLEQNNSEGVIVECKVIRDKFSGASRGFGFVTFDSKDSASRCCNLNGIEMEGRVVRSFYITITQFGILRFGCRSKSN